MLKNISRSGANPNPFLTTFQSLQTSKEDATIKVRTVKGAWKDDVLAHVAFTGATMTMNDQNINCANEAPSQE